MRVMVLLKASREREAGLLPAAELLAAMRKFNEDLVKEGVLLAGEGLQPSSLGRRVRFSSGRGAVVHGPFTGAEDLIAGFWLWQVRSMDEAVQWVKRCPVPREAEGSEIDIRPVYEPADFGPALASEAREAEQRLREQAGAPQASSPHASPRGGQ